MSKATGVVMIYSSQARIFLVVHRPLAEVGDGKKRVKETFWRELRVWRRVNGIFCVLGAFLALQIVGSAQTKPTRRVLILNEVGISYPLINLVDGGIQKSLENSPYRIEFYREYMDTVQFPDADDQRIIKDFYIRKYANHRPDVIVTVGSSPLRFMSESHQRFFREVPVVYCYPSAPAENEPLDPAFTGVDASLAPASTIALALRLLPGTLHLVVVGGVAPYDRRQQSFVKEQLKPYENRLDISYLTELPAPVLVERLEHLPRHTIVLMTALGRDSAGTLFNANESGVMVASAANAPVFSLIDRYFNHGEVGGDLSTAGEQGRIIGGIVLHLLGGAQPREIPVVKAATNYMFDWRALKRWGIREEDLPPGSIVRNREPTFWGLYKYYVLAGILITFSQTAAILGLIWERVRRRKTEQELRRSEEKFSKSFRHSPLAICVVNASTGHYVEVNDSFELATGWRRIEVIGRAPLEIGLWIDPNQRTAFMKQLVTKGSVKELEVKLRRKDGQIRTTLESAELIDVNSEQCILSVFTDITERKRAEKALSSVSRRLIAAQEQERARIARELHDDINQRLAIVSVRLQSLKQEIATVDVKATLSIDKLCEYVIALGDDIQALSHQLHSSKLEYLGLEIAVRGFCRELSEQQNVEVDFRANGVPKNIDREISLCLFRVVQESLHNAVKYSGMRQFEVLLTGTSNEILLTVSDSGAGFDPDQANLGSGLGLTSMNERMRLVAGQLSIESRPHRGTTIRARVPLTSRGVPTSIVA